MASLLQWATTWTNWSRTTHFDGQHLQKQQACVWFICAASSFITMIGRIHYRTRAASSEARKSLTVLCREHHVSADDVNNSPVLLAYCFSTHCELLYEVIMKTKCTSGLVEKEKSSDTSSTGHGWGAAEPCVPLIDCLKLNYRSLFSNTQYIYISQHYYYIIN